MHVSIQVKAFFFPSNTGISLPGSPSFGALKEYLSLFISNNNNGNILYNGKISYCRFGSCDGQKFMVTGRDSGSAANTGA